MSGARFLGLDIGATKLLALVVDEGGEVLDEAGLPTAREEGPTAVLERCGALARELAERHRCRRLGLGFAGLVDADAGRVTSSVMLPGWDDLPLAGRLSAALDLPCVLENDATAAGLGEFEALGRPEGLHLLVLTVGTGIGGAVFVDGRAYVGASGSAGEFGNATLDWQGESGWGSNRGSLNTLASGTAIARDFARRKNLECARLEDVVVAQTSGDPQALLAIERGARALGAALANAIHLFNPHRIALCGGVLRLGASWWEFVREEAHARSFREACEVVTIGPAVHGARTGAFGAACLARQAEAGA